MWNIFLINGKRQIEQQSALLTHKGLKALYQESLPEFIKKNNWKKNRLIVEKEKGSNYPSAFDWITDLLCYILVCVLFVGAS